MNRKYKIWADILAAGHLLVMAFGAGLFVAVAFFHKYKLLTVGFVIATVISWVVFRGCILRDWENKLRKKHSSDGGYESTFMGYYLDKFFGVKIPDVLLSIMLYALTAALFFFAIRLP